LNGSPAVELEVSQRNVRITNPERVYFPARGATKVPDAVFSLGTLLEWADREGH
jgi:hypothetical protein